uniref:Ataxin-10 n=1 Tax=Ascaris lumbricoides TaxID=6252 RepID=A0A0M3IIK4_ASCLU
MSSLCTNPDEGFFAFSEYSFKRFVMLVYSLRRATMDEDSTRIFDALFVHRALDPVVLTAFRKYCAADESSASYLDSLKEENLASFIRSIFEAVLKGFDERGKPPELMDDEKRFRRLALQCLVNAANRSRRLRECVDAECVRFLRAMLRLDAFRNEVLACLVAIARPLHKKAALCSEYSDLLNDVTLLWKHSSTTSTQRSWISALVSIHLEEDYAFLAECFADMDGDAFSELLVIVEALLDHSETEDYAFLAECFADMDGDAFSELLIIVEALLDQSETGQCVQIHSNNAQFCVNLLERMEYEIGKLELPSTSTNDAISREKTLKFSAIERLSNLISIVSSLSLRRPQFDALLHNETTATAIVARSLEAVVDYEILKENATVHTPKAPDRPVPPKRTRREAVKLPFVKNLSELLRCNVAEEEQIAELKCACVRALGNLCCESPSNQRIVGKHDGVILLLHCARRLDTDSPFLMQWAIAALRHVCMGCPENQQRLAEIEQCPSAIVDRDRLLLQLGLKAVIEEDTGKIR